MVTTLDGSTTQDHNVSMMVSTNQTSHDMVTTPDETAGVYCCLFFTHNKLKGVFPIEVGRMT